MSIAGPAEVECLDVMIAHFADRRRSRYEIVLVVMARSFVEVRVEAELRGVAFRQKILAVSVENDHTLVASVEFVEIGISVLLAHVERHHIVLPAIVVVIAEETEAEVGVVENETAKIAHERLDPEARGKEIVIVREIADVDFAERFLERLPLFGARGVTRAGEITRESRQSRPESGSRIAGIGKSGDWLGRGETGPARIRIERVVFLHANVILIRDEE